MLQLFPSEFFPPPNKVEQYYVYYHKELIKEESVFPTHLANTLSITAKFLAINML